MTGTADAPLPRLFVDFNTTMAHSHGWVVFDPDPVDLAWVAVGRRVLLEETPTVMIEGRRHFISWGTAGYESIEVEALLRFDSEGGAWPGYWEAEPDWLTLRYVTYPVSPTADLD